MTPKPGIPLIHRSNPPDEHMPYHREEPCDCEPSEGVLIENHYAGCISAMTFGAGHQRCQCPCHDETAR